MGIDVSCHLFYGVPLEEGRIYDDQFNPIGWSAPWKAEDNEGNTAFDGLEEFWRKEHGYNNPYEDYSADNYRQYRQYRDAFDAQFPCPFAELNDGSYDGEMREYLAIARTVVNGDWSEPTRVDPAALTVTDDDMRLLRDFVARYNVKTAGEPAWYLIARLS